MNSSVLPSRKLRSRPLYMMAERGFQTPPWHDCVASRWSVRDLCQHVSGSIDYAMP